MDHDVFLGHEEPRRTIGYLIRRIERLAESRISASLAEGDITMTQWIVLALINAGTASTPSRLARNLGHDTGAMSRLIECLVNRGLAERRPSESDRRVTELTLTAEGQATLHGQGEHVRNVWKEALSALEPEEVAQLASLLLRVLTRFEQLEGDDE